MDKNNSLGKLTEESLKRKERLQQLRAKAGGATKNDNTDNGSDQLPKPIFRSYVPQNEHTKGEILPQEPSGDIESAVESQINLLQQPMVVDDIDITNLAPRKPDWDLKRDVSKKLERLDRRTQKAIAELIRERLKMNQVDDICQAVNVGTALAAQNVENDID